MVPHLHPVRLMSCSRCGRRLWTYLWWDGAAYCHVCISDALAEGGIIAIPTRLAGELPEICSTWLMPDVIVYRGARTCQICLTDRLIEDGVIAELIAPDG